MRSGLIIITKVNREVIFPLSRQEGVSGYNRMTGLGIMDSGKRIQTDEKKGGSWRGHEGKKYLGPWLGLNEKHKRMCW